MKNQSGITLISLVVTIILILIFATVTTHESIDSYKSMKAQAFVAKMKAIQEKVDNLCEKYTVSEIMSNNQIGVESSSAIIPASDKAVLNSVIADGSAGKLKCWDSVDAISTNYKYFTVESIASVLGLSDFDVAVFVNPSTRNVIAVDGVTVNDVKYYRQYDLSGGQVLEKANLNVNFKLEYSVQTFLDKAVITCIRKNTSGTVLSPNFSEIKYSKKNGEAYSDEKVLSNTSEITLTESGIYKIVATDETGNTQTAENISVAIVNKPLLVDGMTPVKYNGSSWVDCTVDDPDWYNYSSSAKKWANVKLKDGSYYVWIPRFAYELTANASNTDGTINIKFLSGITSTGTDGKAIGSTYKVAPAFQNGSISGYKNGEWDSELTGFWVAKYESINNSSKPKSTAQSSSCWVSIAPKTAFETCRKMESDYRDTYFNTTVAKASGTLTYGKFETDTNNLDTHLIKNSEWGAVAYLTYSDYGNKTVSKKTSYVTNADTGNAFSSNNNNTGIYGLSGGAHDLVAAGVNIEGYYNETNVSTKYATVYAGSLASDTIYGDALKETSGWKSCTATYPTQLICRGGDKADSTCGIFGYQNKIYDAHNTVTFRPVIVVEY